MSNATAAELIVLGMGPAGESVAGQLADAGLDVIGIDAELVGGECPYWGCIPSKMMIRAAHLLTEARRVPGVAGKVEVTPDWAPVAARIREEATDDWDDTVAVERFESKGGRFVRGRGRLTGPRSVGVNGTVYEATHGLVIATGTTAAIPPIPGLSGTPLWTNREAVAAAQLPSSMIVLGGGAIGAELAQTYSRFGVETTIVEAADRLLPLEEPESGDLVARVFTDEGICVHAGVSATSVRHQGNTFEVTLADDHRVSAERLLIATGRRVDLSAINARALGIDETMGALPVDEDLRVTDGVWAVGDVTGQGAFTHVGMYQAAIAVADILGRDHEPASYHALPRVTFTDPEVGSVGFTAASASDAGIDVATSAVGVPGTARGWLHKTGNEGVIKLVADRATGVLVGATAAGPNGGEVLGLLALAVHAHVPVEQLRSMIWAYPTFHRGIEDALRDLDV